LHASKILTSLFKILFKQLNKHTPHTQNLQNDHKTPHNNSRKFIEQTLFLLFNIFRHKFRHSFELKKKTAENSLKHFFAIQKTIINLNGFVILNVFYEVFNVLFNLISFFFFENEIFF
jgi:hypothetical protein